MNPKVSILVPIYNVSLYIERCARSLFDQTFENIEYIFVDDASTDDSLDILKKVLKQYPKRQKQVRIIRHPQNKGLASTRNTAIDASNGDYIAVVDSDDYVEKNMIEELYNFAVTKNADIVVFDSVFEYAKEKEYISDELSTEKVENIEKILSQKISHSIWNRFVKKEFFKMVECRVPEGLNYGEDFHVTFRLMYYAERIYKINKTFYHYNCENNQSITKEVTEMHFENSLQLWQLVDEFLKNKNLFERYGSIIDRPKAERKLRLILDTSNPKLRKKYASIFEKEELRCLQIFSKGERLFLWLLRNKFYIIFEFFHKVLLFKNRINLISNITTLK